MNFSVISIGTLAANPLWNERAPQRTGHATTTLVSTKDMHILVDPGLPAQALTARLAERTNLKPSDITHVFLTQFHPETRRAITAFDQAKWLISEAEREAIGGHLATKALHLAQTGDAGELLEVLQQDIALLRRCEVAPDQIAEGVDIFPLPGVSPGMCGLLLSGRRNTTLVCGDAICTHQFLVEGKVLPTAMNLELARESFQEAIEIADFIVLGRDNLVPNPTKRGF